MSKPTLDMTRVSRFLAELHSNPALGGRFMQDPNSVLRERFGVELAPQTIMQLQQVLDRFNTDMNRIVRADPKVGVGLPNINYYCPGAPIPPPVS